jgi:hypothetical protein
VVQLGLAGATRMTAVKKKKAVSVCTLGMRTHILVCGSSYVGRHADTYTSMQQLGMRTHILVGSSYADTYTSVQQLCGEVCGHIC